MEDMEDDLSSTGFEPLFIREDDREPFETNMEQRERHTTQSGCFTGIPLNPSAFIGPYLQEMDDLLKSCEELTGIPFGSRFSETHGETSLSGPKYLGDMNEDTKKSHTGMSVSPHTYPSTSYFDTHMDGAGTQDQPELCQSRSMGTIINRCGMAPGVSRQTEMPLTSAGKKLSETMVEYEGQLLGMLEMLDSSVQDTRMDYEPQNWSADTSQEYVHICTNPQVPRETRHVSNKQESSENQEPQPMQLEYAGDDTVSKDSGHELKEGSAPRESHQNYFSRAENSCGFSEERPERFTTDQDLDKWIRILQPVKASDCNSMVCEGAMPEYTFKVDGSGKGKVLPAEQNAKMDTTHFRSSVDELGVLGSQMEKCIEDVQMLEKKRKKLLVEAMKLRGDKAKGDTEGSSDEEEETEEGIDSKVAELMNILKKEEEARREERKREIQNLKEERADEERRMWKVNLERQGLQDELRKLRRRLFTVARDCAHNQATLNSQHRAVELLKREEEQLQSLVLQLTEESCQIRATQQKLLSEVQAHLHAHSSSQMSNTQEELSECRRYSCGDIQQYVQGGLRSLESRYEPIMLALLKRREAAAGALVKAREQAQELKAQLGPLIEETQKLKLQKACLEEKFKLIHIHWKEDVARFKETMCCLEEKSRELKTELKFQKKKTKDTEGLRDSLAKKLLLYRAAIEEHNKYNHEEAT